MTVTREVICDLLPLYAAGEASPDTCALVESWLRDDPELVLQVQRLRVNESSEAMDVTLPVGVEMRSLRRTKRLLAMRRWLFGLGLTFTLIGLSFEVQTDAGHAHQFHLLMFKDPHYYGSSFLLGAALLFTDRLLRADAHKRRSRKP